jgi:hypothetical protein
VSVPRVAAIAAALCIAGGCAHVEAPRGGPEMRDPLTLVEVDPDSLAIVPGRRGPVEFIFSARLSERGLDDAVLVSPRTSAVRVSHRGRALRVDLREGWRPGVIYQVTIAPAIQDLWSNRLEETTTLVFSTGPEIPETRVDGVATDRITGRPETEIRVEAIRMADSLVYATRSDSAGAFRFHNIPEGEYRIRAYRDTNRNRELDPFEPRDTMEVAVVQTDTVSTRLRVVAPDTTPPVAESAAWADGRIEVEFDDYLDEAQSLSRAQVRVLGPGDVEVPLERVALGAFADEPEAEAPAEPGLDPAAPPAIDPEAPPPGNGALPSRRIVVQPAEPLAPDTEYRVIIERVRNVVGLVGGGDVTFTTPAAPPPDADPEEEPDVAPPAAPPPPSITASPSHTRTQG